MFYDAMEKKYQADVEENGSIIQAVSATGKTFDKDNPAAKLAPMGEFGRNIVTRNPEPMKRGKIYEYDQERADLILAMAEIQNRAERTLPPPQTAFQDIVQHEPYPVEGKAREIIRRLKEQGITRFRLLFKGSRSRSEVVATFLAVLELCRAHVLHLAGSETDCTVRQEGELPENLTL